MQSDDSSKGVKDWKHNGALCWAERESNEGGNSSLNQKIFDEGILNQDYFRKMIRVKFLDREEEIPTERIFQRSSAQALSQQTEEDMVNLKVLNDAELLANLEKRYSDDHIHTYIGPTLLTINPFRPLPDLVSEDQMRLYYSEIIENTKNNGSLAMRSLPPSPFAIAAEAYRSLFDMEKNQAIVISGESGAGKTENTKLCMKFLTTSVILNHQKSPEKNFRSRKVTVSQIGSQIQQPSLLLSPKSQSLAKNPETIEEKILSCNPVLESFGNAKTVKNDNSSRFGKYVTLIVDMKENKIIGAEITNYLLEKVRIIQQGQGERNFHIFYHLLSGSSKSDLARIGLENHKAEDFAYLKNQNMVVPTINDSHLFEEVLRAFEVLGLKEFQEAILRMLSAILHFGNLSFDDSTRDENHPCNVKNNGQLRLISELLGIDAGELERQLTSKYQIVSGIGYPKYFTLEVCQNQRDSISKELYDRLFNWLVFELNKTIMPVGISKPQLKNNQLYKTIGLLDIYGFEVFAKNGFEQFFINYTNERLQQLYIQYVFKAEEMTFSEEGLSEYFKKLDFKDNQEVIDILDSQVEPLGIFKLLEDRCKNPAASLDQNLLNDIRKKHGDKEKYTKNPQHKFKNPKKINDPTFIIVHTAKEVEYDIKGFIEKNKDEVNFQLIKALSASKNDKVAAIISHTEISIAAKGEIEQPKGRGGGAGGQLDQTVRFRQISQKFIQEMSLLMQELISCNVQFIRCIKPNEDKKPGLFIQRFALNQIRYLGVLESISVRRQSYPIRLQYDTFYKKFGLMMLEVHKTYAAYKDSSSDKPFDFAPLVKELFKRFLGHMGDESVLFGKKKVFLKREETLQEVQVIYARATEEMEKAARKIQLKYHSYITLKKLRRAFKCVRLFQRIWKKYIEHRKAAHVLQKYIRTWVRQTEFQKSYDSIVRIQKQWRVAIKRIKQVRTKKIRNNVIISQVLHVAWLRITNRAALTIQRILKGCMTRGKYPVEVNAIRTFAQRMREYKACCLIQRVYRGQVVRKRLRVLHSSAFLIQGWMKMNWLSDLLSRLKKATRLIQRNVRMFLIKKHERTKRNTEFLGPILSNLNRIRISEDLHLFRGQSQVVEYNAELFKLDRNVESILEKSHEQFFQQRMYLFSYIVDFEILSDTCEIYNPLWSPLYQASFKDNYDRQSYIQHLSVGDTHTLSCSLSSRIHSWGWNDYGQLGVPILDDEEEEEEEQQQLQQGNKPNGLGTQIYSMNVPQQVGRVLQVSTGSNHNLILDSKGSIWSWGSNNKGQLGLNHYNNVDSPQRVSHLPPGQAHANSNKVEFCKVEARRDENYAVSRDGRLFHWPTIGPSGECINYPLEVVIPKISIKDVSSGCNFTMMLAANGLLFSVGSDNNEGELGTGDTFPRRIPTLLSSLKDAGEKIAQIDCGFKHTIARTSLGKIYTWGWGERGQLGHGELRNEVYPRLLRTSKISLDKPLQVTAGHKCSLILTEKRKIFQCGQNSQISHTPEFVEFHIKQKSEKLSQSFYEPVRVQTTWSKSLSVISVTYGNTKKAFEKNAVLKSKTLNNLTMKWAENNIDSVDPPFIEKIANFISEKNMKMPIVRNPNVQFESKKIFQKLQSDIQEASYQHIVEQQYNTAVESENQLLSPRGQAQYYEQQTQEIVPQSENWSAFQKLGLAESTASSQMDNNESFMTQQSARFPLSQRKSLVQQPTSMKSSKTKSQKSREDNSIDKSKKLVQPRSSITSQQSSQQPRQQQVAAPDSSRVEGQQFIDDQLDKEKKIQIVREKAIQLYKIPKSEWSEVDHEFMKGVVQLNILPQGIDPNELTGGNASLNGNSESNSLYSSKQLKKQGDYQQQNRVQNNTNEDVSNGGGDAMFLNVKMKWEEIRQKPQSAWTQSDLEFMGIVRANNLEKIFNSSQN